MQLIEVAIGHLDRIRDASRTRFIALDTLPSNEDAIARNGVAGFNEDNITYDEFLFEIQEAII